MQDEIVPDLSQVDRSRRQRLRQELTDEGFPLDESPINDLLIDEVAYARYVNVHEGIFPNYGALVGKSGCIPEDATVKKGIAPAALRKFADGETSFIVRRADEPASIMLALHRVSDELDAVTLCRDTDSAYVQRLGSGTITVTTTKRILINEGYTWRSRPVARYYTHDLNSILSLAEIEIRPLITKLLDFAFHQLSPQRIGATLVVDMQGDSSALMTHLSGEGVKLPFDFNLNNDEDARLMVNYLRVVDGACFVASSGIVTRGETKLQVTDNATSKLKPEGGMRHSSAKWFSYEHPEVLVIVVSADGPVSLFSSGGKIALFDQEPSLVLSGVTLSVEQRSELKKRIIEIVCSACGTAVRLELDSHPNSDRKQQPQCPVCSGELETLSTTKFLAYPAKPWFRPI